MFDKIALNKCSFKKCKTGILTKAWFKSYYFLETDFSCFNGPSLIQTVLVDSEFCKFNKSIKFKGNFVLIDILVFPFYR
jgi:hypothetical protein